MKLAYRSEKNAEAVARYWGKSLEKPDWYKIEAKDDDNNAEIIIYDVVGWPYIDAFDLIRNLGTIKAKNISVRINSPGGDVFDGVAIFNALKEHPAHVTTKIEGLAASIASIIALAGDEVQAHKNAMYMVHDPWVLAAGNQYDLREIADILEKISGNMVDIYSQNSNIGKKEIREMLKAETWFTAKEAKERGFIDTIIDGKAVKAQFDLSMYANAPDGFDAVAGREPTERDAEKALRDAGFSRNKAKAILARGLKPDAREEEILAAQNLLKIIGG